MNGHDQKYRLTSLEAPVYSGRQVLNNASTSGSPSRKSNGFTPMGGMRQQYKTLTGKAACRLVAVINILPASLNNEVPSLNKEQNHA